MEYKYENIENVETKTDFSVHKVDENNEIVETFNVPKGAKGIIESMGCSSTFNFTPYYDLVFKVNDTEIEVFLSEEKMEEYLIMEP